MLSKSNGHIEQQEDFTGSPPENLLGPASSCGFDGQVVIRCGRIAETNLQFADLTGYSPHELLGLEATLVLETRLPGSADDTFSEVDDKATELRLRRKSGDSLTVAARRSEITLNGQAVTLLSVREQPSLDQRSAVMAARLRLMEMAQSGRIEGLPEAVLNEAKLLTQSRLGMFHLVDEDSRHLSLQAWSNATAINSFSVGTKAESYTMSGVDPWRKHWLTHEPLICNDYKGSGTEFGLPEGHTQMQRLALAPIVRAGKTVALLGVGNKESDYLDHDAKTIAELADLAWDVIELHQAHSLLRESEDRLRLATAATSDGIWDWNILTGENYFSDRWCDLLGYSREELDPHIRTWQKMLHPDDIDRTLRLLEDHLAGREPFDLEYRLKHKSRGYLWFRARGQVQRDSGGQAVRMVGTIEDVTQAKLAAEELALQKEKYHSFIANSHEAIYCTEFDQPIDTSLSVEEQIDAIYRNAYMGECNLAMSRMYGVEGPEDFSGRRMVDAHGGSDNPVNRESLRRFIEGGYVSQNIETDEIGADGSRLSFVSNDVGILEHGKLVRIWGSATDVTARRKAEAALRESEQRFRAVFEKAPLGVALIDTATGRFMQVNPRYCQILGRSRDELSGMYFQSVTHPEDLEADLKQMELLKKGEISQFSLEKRYIRPDGASVWGQLTVVPMWEQGTAPTHHLAMVEDINERKEFVNALAQERDHAELVLDTIPTIVVALDRHGIVTQANAATCELLGCDAAEIIGKNWFESFLRAATNETEDARSVFDQIMAGKLEPVHYFENFVLTKTGQHRLVAWNNTTIQSAAGEIVGTLSAGTDITERREVEAALQKREREYRELFETVSEGIVSTEVTDFSRFVLANPAAEKLFGVKPGGLIGRRLAEFCDAEGLRIIEEQWELRQAGETTTYEMPLIRDDGERRVMRVTASPVIRNAGQVAGSYSLLQDVTEARAAEAKLREHVAFLEAIDRIDGVMRRADGYDELILGTLEQMRKEFGCSRAWLLYPLDPKAAAFSIPWEVTAPEYPGANLEGAQLPVDEETAELFRTCLSGDVALEFGEHAEHKLPKASAEHFCILSQLLLPVYPRSGSPWLIGMHQCDRARVWSEYEKRLLREIGNRLTDGLSAEIAIESLRDSEERYRQLVETVSAVPWEYDLKEDKWTYVAPQVEALLGYKPEEFTNLQWWIDHVHDEDRGWAPGYCMEQTSAGVDHVFEYRFISKGGKVVWIHDIVHVVMSADGPLALRGYMIDVSEAKQLELALAHETDLLNGLMEAIPDTVYIKDRQSRFIRINAAQARLLGVADKSEAIGRSDADFFAPEEAEWRRADEIRIMETGEGQVGMLEELPPQNGRARWISATKLPRYDASGKVIGIYGISRDVSPLVEAQLRLQEHEERYSALINTAQEGFWVVESDGTIVEVNETYCRMLGYTHEQVLGQHVTKFSTVEGPELARQRMEEILAAGWAHFESRHRHADGSELDVRVSTTVIRPSNRFLVFFRDITESKRAAAQLAWSEERYRSFVSRSSEGIWCFEVDEPIPMNLSVEEQVRLCFERGYLSECNDAYAHMYGVSDAGQMKGARLADLMPASEQKNVEYLREAVEAGYAIRDARSYEVDSEGRLHVILNNMVGVVEEGKLVRAWGMQRDITAQVEAEKALRESEQRWQFALEGSGAGIWDWNAIEDQVFFSRQWKAMLGYDEDDIGTSLSEWSDRVHPDDMPGVMAAIDAHLDGKSDSYQSEHRMRCKDGSYKWILDRGKIIEWDKEGKPQRIIGTHTDISEIKAVEKELQDYVGWLEQAEEVGRFASWDWDYHTGEVRWSRHYYDLLGYPEGSVTPSFELFGKHVHPDDLQALDKVRLASATLEQPTSYRHRIITAQNEVRWVEQSAALIREPDGSKRFLGITRDITEEVKVDEALSQERETAQRILDTAETLIVAIDAEGRITSINRHACETLGYEAAELIGKDWFEVCLPQPEDLETVKHVFQQIIQGNTDPTDYFEKEIRTRDGRHLMVAWRNTFTRNASGAYSGVLSAGQDITDRIISRRALQASEDKYRRLVEMAAEGIVALDRDAVVTFANPRILELLGCSADQMVGSSITKFMFPADLHIIEEKMAERRKGQTSSYEQRYKRADGSEVWCLISGSPVFEDGEFVGSFAMVTDITERRRVEAQLLQAQKAEALGTMLGGIAHDFNNLLFAILGSGELVLEALTPNTQVFEDMRMLMAAGGRAKELVQQLLAFSRSSSSKTEVSDARQIVNETLMLLRRAIPSYITIEADTGEDAVQVKANPTQLQQVVMNLCMNAVQAMEPLPGTMRVSVSGAETAQVPGQHGTEDSSHGEAIIRIADTGTGMPASILERIFDPYFTTKSKGRGTGLGLAVVQGILKQLGGSIEVTSEVGQGTEVTVRLPVFAGELDAAESVEHREDKLMVRVLIVDDEPDLVVIIRRMLERAGCATECCSSPHEAISLLREAHSRIDLVLTDFSMPGLTGLQLATQICEFAPELPVIIYSGNPTELVFEHLRAPNVKMVLQKPISRAALMEGISATVVRAKSEGKPDEALAGQTS